MAARSTAQRHVMRYESAVEIRLRAHRGTARVLWRLRSIRRFRFALWRGKAEPENRRSSDSLSRANIRHDKYPALASRRAAAAHDVVRRPAHQVRVAATFRPV